CGIADHERTPRGEFLGQLPMGPSNRFKGHVLGIEQSVRSFEIAPFLRLIGEAGGRIAGDLFSYSNQTFRPSLVSQLARTKIHLSPLVYRLHRSTSVTACQHRLLSLPSAMLGYPASCMGSRTSTQLSLIPSPPRHKSKHTNVLPLLRMQFNA